MIKKDHFRNHLYIHLQTDDKKIEVIQRLFQLMTRKVRNTNYLFT